MRLSVALQAVVIITAMLLLFWLSVKSNQSIMSMPIQEKFIGEYSFDGGRSWKPLEDDTKLSAYDGELILRGNFEYVMAE